MPVTGTKQQKIAIPARLVQAKQVLSARLLGASVRAQGAGLRPAVAMAAVAASAGRNVHAVGIGWKRVAGKQTDTMAVRLYVAHKIAPSALAPRDRLPEIVDGIPTDVVEAPLAFIAAGRRSVATSAVASAVLPAADPRQQQRPVCAGISVSHPDVTAGTLGYFCRSRRHGDDPAGVCILSNNHVLANLNRGAVGDPIYQPGSIDGGCPASAIATLKRWQAMQLDGVTPNSVDGAIADLMPDVQHRLEISSIGKVAGVTRATAGMSIVKHGRTTGYAEGVVTDESIDALVGMAPNDPASVALFQNQMRLEPKAGHPAIGLGGDSGSLVVESETMKAVGLYFANPASGQYGYANHIEAVLTALEIELL